MVSRLTSDIDMEVDETLLMTRFEQWNSNKDEIFKKRAGKLEEIAYEIKKFEMLIKQR